MNCAHFMATPPVWLHFSSKYHCIRIVCPYLVFVTLCDELGQRGSQSTLCASLTSRTRYSMYLKAFVNFVVDLTSERHLRCSPKAAKFFTEAISRLGFFGGVNQCHCEFREYGCYKYISSFFYSWCTPLGVNFICSVQFLFFVVSPQLTKCTCTGHFGNAVI